MNRAIQVSLLLSISLISACGQVSVRNPAPESNVASQYTIHVAIDGDDDWSGALKSPAQDGSDGPFATLERARDEIRILRQGGRLSRHSGTEVVVHEGTYRLDSAFVLTEVDSGTETHPVVYRSADGAKVVIAGSREVNGFRVYKNEVMQSDVRELNLRDLSMKTNDPVLTCELFYNGIRQQPARWPNFDPQDRGAGEWSYVRAVPDGKTWTRFSYMGDRPASWQNPSTAQVHIFAHWDWADDFVGVESVDADSAAINLADPTRYNIIAGRRFYVRNVFEELDAPGEWFLDRDDDLLYFWPPDHVDRVDGVDLTESIGTTTVSYVDTLIHLKSASNVTLRGFVLEECRKEAVSVVGGNNNTIAACTIRNTGAYGASINGGTSNGLSGCDISYVGLGGVLLSGGDRPSLTPASNYVDNCHIHHYGRTVKCYSAAVKISGVGNRITHNLIHDAPHCAVLLTGNDHLIEYNEIHNVIEEAQDAGAFYLGRDWTERGNVVRYNSFHDLYGYGMSGGSEYMGVYMYATPRASWAVYLDDCASGTSIYGNVFYRCALTAAHLGGGHDNSFENNIVIDCYPPVHMNDRRGNTTTLMRRLEEMNYREPPYAERYPELVSVLDGDPFLGKRNSISHNVVWYTRDDVQGFWGIGKKPASSYVWELKNFDPTTTTIDSNLIWHDDSPIRVAHNAYGDTRTLTDWDDWKGLGFDAASQVADPLFVDADRDDYRLKDDSPAYALGFQPIPFDSIGLYEHANRAVWPVDRQLRKGVIEEQKWTVKLFDFETEGQWHFVKDYAVAGPFPLEWDGTWTDSTMTVANSLPGFNRPFEPENRANWTAVARFETMDGESGWKRVSRNEVGYLDLNLHLQTTVNTVAYVRYTISSPDRRQIKLSIGTNDGARVWLNGTLVHTDETAHGAVPHQNIVPVELNPGSNTVLAKIYNVGGGWGLYMAVDDPDRELSLDVE
jgi:hypothetical protein